MFYVYENIQKCVDHTRSNVAVPTEGKLRFTRNQHSCQCTIICLTLPRNDVPRIHFTWVALCPISFEQPIKQSFLEDFNLRSRLLALIHRRCCLLRFTIAGDTPTHGWSMGILLVYTHYFFHSSLFLWACSGSVIVLEHSDFRL